MQQSSKKLQNSRPDSKMQSMVANQKERRGANSQEEIVIRIIKKQINLLNIWTCVKRIKKFEYKVGERDGKFLIQPLRN